VSASRVSWFNTGVTYGLFDNSSTNSGIGYEYVERLAQNLSAGQALYLAKASMAPESNTRLMNWYDFNLYGDPEAGLVNDVPLYYLNTSATAGGVVSQPGLGLNGPYTPGQVVNISAAADACSYFVNWTGNTSIIANASAPSTTITMNASYSITANFASLGITYNLTVSSGGNGSASPSGTTSQGCNASVPIAANASACYKFLNWSGPSVDSVSNVNAASATILMNGSKTIQANFVLAPEDINCDGDVDLFDLVRLGLHWGETGSPGWIAEDINITPDGVIDLFDLVILGIYWTG
jgi:hypothetical protein